MSDAITVLASHVLASLDEADPFDFSSLTSSLGRVPNPPPAELPSWPATVSAESFSDGAMGAVLEIKPLTPATGPSYAVLPGTWTAEGGRVNVWSDSGARGCSSEWFDDHAQRWIKGLVTISGASLQPGVETEMGELSLMVSLEGGAALVRAGIRGMPPAQARPLADVMRMQLVADAIDFRWIDWRPRGAGPVPVNIEAALAVCPGAVEAMELLAQAGYIRPADVRGGATQLHEDESIRLLQLVAALARQVGRADRLSAAFRVTPPGTPPLEAVLTLSLGIHALAHVSRSFLHPFMDKWVKFRELFGATPTAIAQVVHAVAGTQAQSSSPAPAAGAAASSLAPSPAPASSSSSIPALAPPSSLGFGTPLPSAGQFSRSLSPLSDMSRSFTASPDPHSSADRPPPVQFASVAPASALPIAQVVQPSSSAFPLALAMPSPSTAPLPASPPSAAPGVAPPAAAAPAASAMGSAPAAARASGAAGGVPAPSAAHAASTAAASLSMASTLMRVFAYVGFSGSPEQLVHRLGGDTFLADLAAIATAAGAVRIPLSSVPKAVTADRDLVSAITFVDAAYARTAAAGEWLYDWQAIRAEFATPPPNPLGAVDRLVALTSIVAYAHTRGSSSAATSHGAAAPPASSVELAAQRLARTTEMPSVAEGSEQLAWAAGRTLLDTLTTDDAINSIHELDASTPPDAGAASAVKAIISMPLVGQAAEAAIFSSFKAPSTSGKLDRVPLPLQRRRSALISEAESDIREHVGPTRMGVGEMHALRGFVTCMLFAKLPPGRDITVKLGGEAPVRPSADGRRQLFLKTVVAPDGSTSLEPASSVSLGTWGSPDDKRDAERAFAFLERMLWKMFYETGAHQSMDEYYASSPLIPRPEETVLPAGDSPLRFGLLHGVRFQLSRGVPLQEVYTLFDYAVGVVANQQWERRTVAGAPRASWAAAFARLFDVAQMQALAMGPRPSPSPPPSAVANPFAASSPATQQAAAQQVATPGAPPAATADGFPARVGRGGKPLAVGGDGFTDWERQVYSSMLARDRTLTPDAARRAVRGMAPSALVAAVKELGPSPKKPKAPPQPRAAQPPAAAPAAAPVSAAVFAAAPPPPTFPTWAG